MTHTVELCHSLGYESWGELDLDPCDLILRFGNKQDLIDFEAWWNVIGKKIFKEYKCPTT